MHSGCYGLPTGNCRCALIRPGFSPVAPLDLLLKTRNAAKRAKENISKECGTRGDRNRSQERVALLVCADDENN